MNTDILLDERTRKAAVEQLPDVDTEASSDKPPENRTLQQQDESIQREAQEAASKIIQSMPEIPLVDECLKEVAAAESAGDSGVLVDAGDANESEDVAAVSETVGASVPTIQDEPEPINESTQAEQSMPLKSSTPAKKSFPKTPPPSLFSPAQEEVIEAPVDTEDYSLLKDYWKKQSDKHAFSPPTKEAKPNSAKETKESLSRSTSKENNAASAAVASLMVAGALNVLDHMLPSPNVASKTLEEEEGVVPLVDESMAVDKEDNTQSPAKSAVAEMEVKNTKAATPPPEEEDKHDNSDENLILPSEGSSSPPSSDKSSNDDYVKIVRTPSGDPISESQLLVGRPDVIDVKKEEKADTKIEASAAKVSKESVAASMDASAAVSVIAGEEGKIASTKESSAEETPQPKSKSKNKKKKKGKKK